MNPSTHAELLKALSGHRSAKLANNTYVMHGADPGTIVVMLHGTAILTYANEAIIPYTGGWNTLTTANRLNRYTPDRFTFRCRDGFITVTDDDGPTVSVEHVLYLDPEAPDGEGIIERMQP